MQDKSDHGILPESHYFLLSFDILFYLLHKKVNYFQNILKRFMNFADRQFTDQNFPEILNYW